jgi:IS5 family transposase
MDNLSDDVLTARWLENPYYQLFCGEEFFRHKAPFDRSSMTRWRQRMGEERLSALVQESLATATRTGAAKPADFSQAIVDTTVQPKAVAHPTDAKLMNRAREKLARLAKQHGVALRQSYERVGKRALIAYQRYAHAKQFKRANRALRTLRTYLGRVMRDIKRKIRGDETRQAIFRRLLWLAERVSEQRQKERGRKVYSLHAPEVECIGKGKAHRPYEFGVKVSVATTLHRSKGGQFITHVKALPGNPYDGHTLATAIPEIEAQIGATLERIVADRGYRGHNAPPDHRFRVYISGQKRNVTKAIQRDLRRRAAVEPVIGHAKEEHRLERFPILVNREGFPNQVCSDSSCAPAEEAGKHGSFARSSRAVGCGGDCRSVASGGRRTLWRERGKRGALDAALSRDGELFSQAFWRRPSVGADRAACRFHSGRCRRAAGHHAERAAREAD